MTTRFRKDGGLMSPPRFRERTAVGDIFEDVADVATSVVDTTVDVTTSVFDRIPGSGAMKDVAGVLSGPVEDFVKGPMRDFANTGVGTAIFRAASVSVSMMTYMINPALGPYVFPWVGPTLAFAAWSIPGMAKGQPFDEAMVKEFAFRVAFIVKYFVDSWSKEALGLDLGAKIDDFLKDKGGALTKEINEQFLKAIDKGKEEIKKAFPVFSTEDALREFGLLPDAVLENMGLTPQALAKKLNIREDMAALALGWMRRDPKYFTRIKNFYDLKTGRDTQAERLARIKLEQDQRKAVYLRSLYAILDADPCQAYSKALAVDFLEEARAFKKVCDQRKIQNAALATMLKKNPCEAYVMAIRSNRMDAPLFKERCAAFKKTSAFVTSQAMMGPKETASAKATKTVLLATGAVVILGGVALYLYKRGK
jgi:hypothetical protein